MEPRSVTAIDALAPIPEISVVELAVVICFTRRPGSDVASVVAEIGRWFNISLVESDISNALRRLIHREWLTTDGIALHATEAARDKAELAARGIVQLIYRDRYFFDVGKLLDVTLIREDRPDAE
ncbi:hypothetical protein [Sphingomonas sp. SUN039]|uniref:hypothetical protein n=1 Tax=Sphingomonas sp. SUN039 TaxID=2937787 RepID=UPI002164C0AA|nr:hypothetical protein [Sphingomonas sp. SUN039]UVO53790.1 hypothetical protein M0209_06510 [Sphingomonas sp. SUN039]